MKVYAVKVFDIDLPEFNRLLKYISSEKKEKIHRFIKKEDKHRALIAEMLIRKVINENLSINNEDIDFIKNEFGKPFLSGHEKFHFNISHSGDWVVCAIDQEAVGIDVEKISVIEYKGLAQNFFTDKECNFIFEAGPDEQLENFYRLWSLKESYIKAEGKGLSIPLKSFTINVSDNEGIGVIRGNNREKWCLKEYSIDQAYKMAVCSSNARFPDGVHIISRSNLFSYFNSIN